MPPLILQRQPTLSNRGPQAKKRIRKLLSTLPPLDIPLTSTPLREFTFFKRLPLELRLAIWGLAASKPRAVMLVELDKNCAPIDQTWKSSVEGQPRHPGIMQACRESRSEGGRTYELCFELEQRHGKRSKSVVYTAAKLRKANGKALKSKGNAVYINFLRDIFHLPTTEWRFSRFAKVDTLDYNFRPTDLRRIERLHQLSNIGIVITPVLILERLAIREYVVIFDKALKTPHDTALDTASNHSGDLSSELRFVAIGEEIGETLSMGISGRSFMFAFRTEGDVGEAKVDMNSVYLACFPEYREAER